MATIDSTLHTLECPKCAKKEARRILDKGSEWGASHWQDGARFECFQTSWTGGGHTEPVLSAAYCKNCGGVAIHFHEFGGL